MSMYDALYGREGRGVGPGEPEKKGFARFCQMVGRDLGQLLGTNLLVCVLCLPAALGVSLGVTLLSLPLTVVLSAATGLLAGPAMLLLVDCPCAVCRTTRPSGSPGPGRPLPPAGRLPVPWERWAPWYWAC